MELQPNEQYKLRKEVTKGKGQKGVLGVTNLRVVWMEDSVPSLYYSYSQVVKVEMMRSDMSFMKLTVLNPAGGELNDYFRFEGPTHIDDSDQMQHLIESYMKQSNGDVVVPSAIKAQLTELSRDPILAQLHQALVRQGNMSEEEFWRLQPLPAADTQVAGRIPAVLELQLRESEGFRRVVYFNAEFKARLFRQFPELKSWYQKEVPHLKTEKAFWKTFCELQAENGFQDIIVPSACQNQPVPLLLEDDLPPGIGWHRRETPDERSAFLIAKFNKHSARIVSEARTPPSFVSTPPIKPDPFSVPENMSVEQLVSPERKGKVVQQLRSAQIARAFPTCFESEERLKHIFRLAHQNQVDSMQQDAKTGAVDTVRKFFELLRYFYSLFPIDSLSDLKRLQVVLKLLGDFYDDHVTVECDCISARHLNSTLSAAEDRLDKARDFWSS